MLCLRKPWTTRLQGVARASSTQALASPLAGIRVLELASVLAGPSVGQFLAELGADVVKVENRKTGGDVTRSWRLRGDSPQQATSYFSCCNLGKRSLAVDASTDRGRDLCRRLAISSDIVLASYKPGDDVKLGLDAAQLRSEAPRLIYAQITGYGLDDPRTGYDAVIQAESGFTFMNGAPAHQGGGPTKMPVALVDLLAAHQLKEAILLALFNRERFGEGAHVHVSLMAAAVASLANQATGYLIAGEVPQRMGSDHPSICPYGTAFYDKDGEALILAVGTDTQFAALCEVLQCSDLAADPRYIRNPDRVMNRQELHAALAVAVAKWHRDELLVALGARKVPAGAVADMAKVFDTDPAQALVVRDEGGKPVGLRQVAWLGDRPSAESPRRPPGFGEHSVEVLTEDLQLSPADVQRLLEDGVVHADESRGL
ncbi:unnamed protein product [Symbiodinium natans]|uniref:Succinate--hydroxymethylglutarate CoA-transferase n=1 Tax=Symbiodinium natans TaxID=878477 RepID=A0A812PUF2_9DINO|nr:unnamed protein product [Symbiodinium natans]